MKTGERLVLDAVERLLERHPPASTDPVEFRGARYDAGLAWLSFPVGLGGLGVDRSFQSVVNRSIEDAGGSPPWLANPIGYGMAAPTLLVHATDEQKNRLLRPMFTGEEIWCQLFSEPGAGSDVANLGTRAVRDGDEWIVNGQKVWTSLAHLARWGLLLARSDPSQPKHAGLTYFMIDMRSDGVETRPLRQANGEAEFNEVYLTDARIPDTQRLGAVGKGWGVAVTTLMNERVAIGGRQVPRGGGPISDSLRLWRERAHTDPVLRDRLARLWIEAEVLRLTNLRASAAGPNVTPGPEGSVGKLFAAELVQRIASLNMSLLGCDAMLYDTYDPPRQALGAVRSTDPRAMFIRSLANTIEGGTSEIMRNILGERVLGLPPEPRVDKAVAWNESLR